MSHILESIESGKLLRQCKFSGKFYVDKVMIPQTTVNQLINGGKLIYCHETHWDNFFAAAQSNHEPN